jgi:hypothetical protein
MFRVSGMTAHSTSFYRLKVFNGTNKIQPNRPIEFNLKKAGSYQYFWFVSTAANSSSEWFYDIYLGI